MARSDLKELKGLNNFNFYPAHYLNNALADDAKNEGYDGKTIKALHKDAEKLLPEIEEGQDGGAREQLSALWFKALGIVDHEGDYNATKDLVVNQKSIQVQTYKIFDLRTGGQLWVFKDDPFAGVNGTESDELRETGAVESGAGGTKHSRSEHFYLHGTKVSQKGDDLFVAWKDLLTSIFDSDFSAAEWIIINQGDRLYLLERERWQTAEGYLEVDANELFMANSDESYRIVHSHFSMEPFAIDSAESFHEKVAQNAHKKAAEVTKALRDTVRESIELIANEVLSSHVGMPNSLLAKFSFDVKEQRQEAAAELFDQALRYIYRMLFMLFTESQDQKKGALPVNSRPYQLGYAIEKMRDLEGVSLQNTSGTFIQQTLECAFSVYYKGYHSSRKASLNSHPGKSEIDKDALGFSFPALGTDLFNPEATKIFSEARLSDGAMQKVIRKLSLAKIGAGKKARTHRVHYAGLGLNQLGAVYEGLLSLRPEILGEKVILLAKEAKDPAHLFVPYARRKDFDAKLFAQDDAGEALIRGKGEFILTPVGLDRKFSASFYTPEVLTRFLAKEAVSILLEKDASLERMESLKICEPAMGSGAFLNAVVDELAPRMAQCYREGDQKAQDKYRSDCEKAKRPYRSQDAPPVYDTSYYISKAKEHLMAHCIYGVDLNATAVELAKVSLWLNCLHEDGNLPFLDFKLRQGNSLVGCWLNKKEYRIDGRPHFLFPPTAIMDIHLKGSILGDKKSPFIADKDERQRLQDLRKDWADWSKQSGVGPRLDKLTKKIDALYERHIQLRVALQKAIFAATGADEKKNIFERFKRENTAYNQIRSMMDYWCSLWFWPHAKIGELPSFEGYLKGLEWMAETPLLYGGLGRNKQVAESGLKELVTSRAVAFACGFFHWDLEFGEVFSEGGGFDLVLGNPPWAPVRWEDADFFEMVQPGINAEKKDSKGKQMAYLDCLQADSDLILPYKDAVNRASGLSQFLKDSGTYPFIDKSSSNTYRYFYQRFLSVTRIDGIHAMIAQDGILTDEGCLEMRPVYYRELVKLFKFKNERLLFEDVHHEVSFALWFSKRSKDDMRFVLIDNLYHPDTIQKSYKESSHAPYRGMKDEDGKFEVRGHPGRIVEISKKEMVSLANFNDGSTWDKVKLPTIHGQIELAVLEALAGHPLKIRESVWAFWRRFDESGAPKAGLITRKPGTAITIAHAVMTGPNVFVGSPANKAPNIPCKNNLDFYEVDLTTIPDDYFPDTVYQATAKGLKSSEYNSETPWGTVHSQEPRIIARQMVSTTGMRTLSSAIIPPGPSHIHSMVSLSFKSQDELLYTSGLFNSLIYDFLMRSVSGGNITQSTYEMTPTLTPEQLKNPLVPALMIRALRLSCISSHYEPLWKEVFRPEFRNFTVKSAFEPKLPYHKLTAKWQRDSCIRDWRQREQALCETDAIVAVLFGFSKDTLLNLYRSQFGVLQKNMQDLPNQKDIKAEEHFPRFQAMSEAYDQCVMETRQTTAA